MGLGYPGAAEGPGRPRKTAGSRNIDMEGEPNMPMPMKPKPKSKPKAGKPKPKPKPKASKPKLGSGGRFKALKDKLAAKGAENPGALAAWIGRRKYGAGKMASMAAAGRRRKTGKKK